MPAQLHARDIVVERGGLTVLGGVSLTIGPGDRIGLVGPNGAGKSTLLQTLAGWSSPTSGTVDATPADATIGLLAQELDSPPGETVATYLARRTGVGAASDALDQAADALAEATPEAFDRHQAALDRWLRLGGADLAARMAGVLVDVGFTGPGEDRSDVPTASLSGGEQARIGLAALLLARYDVLLLDEPTNNLDQRGLAQLEEVVLGLAVPVVVVSHDRRFLERVVTAVVELDDHSRTAVRYNEPYLGYLATRDLARAEAERRFHHYQTDKHRLTDRARRQRDWATKGVKAERKPPDNDRAARGFRVDRTEKLASKARQTERAMDRLAVVDKPWEPWQLRFTLGGAERSGDLVAELVDGVVRQGRFTLGPVTVRVGAGERVAVLGGNGAGKSTLLRALFGQVTLSAGRQRVGRSVLVGWLDQSRPGNEDAGGFLADFEAETGLTPSGARSLLAKFGLDADDLTRPSARWSAGERTRATLAGFAARGVNTIVLDEPTNHLDLPAIEQLEQALT
ncbi:MAG: ATP-binding cassette domain-containing protein, partial [Acidimicrobiia bacterium]|nr:ATP-binding cassette domain-containing protein [Acidimicrobiia bacterium]